MSKNQKRSKLDKSMIFQRVFIFGVFFSFVALLIYSLIFCTPFYPFSRLDGVWLKNSSWESFNVDYSMVPEEAWFYKNNKLLGINMKYYNQFYSDIQGFNNTLFAFGIIGILVSCLLFIYRSQIRKKYYLTNFISSGIVSIFGFFTSINLFIQLTDWMEKFKDINFDILNKYKSYRDDLSEVKTYYSYNADKWVFILGYVLISILVIFIIGLIVVNIKKFISQKKKKELVK